MENLAELAGEVPSLVSHLRANVNHQGRRAIGGEKLHCWSKQDAARQSFSALPVNCVKGHLLQPLVPALHASSHNLAVYLPRFSHRLDSRRLATAIRGMRGVGIHTRFCIGRSLQPSRFRRAAAEEVGLVQDHSAVREDSLHFRAVFPQAPFCRVTFPFCHSTWAKVQFLCRHILGN